MTTLPYAVQPGSLGVGDMAESITSSYQSHQERVADVALYGCHTAQLARFRCAVLLLFFGASNG